MFLNNLIVLVCNFCFNNSPSNKANIFLGLIEYELNSLLGASHLVDYISVHIRFDLERYLLNKINGRDIFSDSLIRPLHGSLGFITIYQSINVMFFKFLSVLLISDNSLILCYSSCFRLVFPLLLYYFK